MTAFHRTALGLLCALVLAGAGTFWQFPPNMVSVSPRAHFASLDEVAAFDESATEAMAATVEVEEPASKLLVLASVAGRASASTLYDAFASIGYDLSSVVAGEEQVPRLFLSSLPPDMGDIQETNTRKSVFFKTVLPLVLQVNDELLGQRRRLWQLRFKSRVGQRLPAADRLWLMVMSERYRVKNGDIDGLLRRVDIIPPSLALAQAAEETGWGTSRFVREGNALFGQWIFTDKAHLTPQEREKGKKHQVMAFDSLLEAARAYAMNLNRHPAYRAFRTKRWDMRRGGDSPDGYTLAGSLLRYSERGQEYVKSLRVIMSANELAGLDRARLYEGETEVATSADPGI